MKRLREGPVLPWLIACLLLAAAVRLPNLGRESLWYDEAVSYMAATLPVPDILGNTIQSSHPPLYYALLHGWLRLAPATDAALRLPGVLLNLALIPATCWLMCLLFGRRDLALWACFLTAVSPFHLLYSQELRMYTQLMLLVTLAVAAQWQAWQSMRRRWWLLSGLLWLAAVYTHLFGFLALAAAGLFAWWRWRWRRQTAYTALLVLAVCLCFTPWLLLLAAETQTNLGSLRPLTQPMGRSWLKLLTTPAFLVFGLSEEPLLTAAALFLTLAMGAVLLLETRRLRAAGVPDGALLLGLLVACTLGIPLLVYGIRPFFLPERTMAAGSPFLIMGLAWLTTRRGTPLPYLAGATAVVLLAGVWLYHARPPIKPPYREAMALVAAQRQAGDVILHTSDGSYLPALRYQPAAPQAVLAGDPDPRKPEAVYAALGGAVWPAETAAAAGQRLWLIVALEHSVDWQQQQARAWDGAYRRIQRQEVGGILITLYDLQPAEPAAGE